MGGSCRIILVIITWRNHEFFFDLNKMPLEPTGVLKRLSILGENAELTFVERDVGAVGGHSHTASHPNTHSNEQFVYCLEGKAEVEVGDEKHTVESGQLVRIPPNIHHSITALTRVRILSVYVPGRDSSKKEVAEGGKGFLVAG